MAVHVAREVAILKQWRYICRLNEFPPIAPHRLKSLFPCPSRTTQAGFSSLCSFLSNYRFGNGGVEREGGKEGKGGGGAQSAFITVHIAAWTSWTRSPQRRTRDKHWKGNHPSCPSLFARKWKKFLCSVLFCRQRRNDSTVCGVNALSSAWCPSGVCPLCVEYLV